MKHEFEFEYKSKISSHHNINSIVSAIMNNKKYKKKHIKQRDIYFDNSKRDLFSKGVFVRSRDSKRLDIKYNPDLLDTSHTGTDEYKCKLPLENTCHNRVIEFLSHFVSQKVCYLYESNHLTEQLGLDNFVVISKERTEYRCHDICVFIDHIDSIGSFIEVEIYNEKEKKIILSLFDSLSLKHLTTGYVELYLRKNDFGTYLKGRYLLEEDR